MEIFGGLCTPAGNVYGSALWTPADVHRTAQQAGARLMPSCWNMHMLTAELAHLPCRTGGEFFCASLNTRMTTSSRSTPNNSRRQYACTDHLLCSSTPDPGSSKQTPLLSVSLAAEAEPVVRSVVDVPEPLQRESSYPWMLSSRA